MNENRHIVIWFSCESVLQRRQAGLLSLFPAFPALVNFLPFEDRFWWRLENWQDQDAAMINCTPAKLHYGRGRSVYSVYFLVLISTIVDSRSLYPKSHGQYL